MGRLGDSVMFSLRLSDTIYPPSNFLFVPAPTDWLWR